MRQSSQILNLKSTAKLKRRIRVALTSEGDWCEIVFSDSGPGIPAQISGRVFDPQFSLKEGGRGMGLTIARRLQ